MRTFVPFAFIGILCVISSSLQAQLYFPPIANNTWETTSPESLGWRTDRINPFYNWLEGKNTRAFIILQDGKIVLEKYFGTFGRDSVWMWASAGKGVTALLTGVAQQEGKLKLGDLSSQYLGKNWTSAVLEKENLITIWHQITMTAGLNDIGTGFTCITPNCLRYVADAGTRWAYHNGPYSLMEDVLVKSTGASSYNAYTQEKLKTQTGMDGTWRALGPNNIYYSRARSMARFGLLMLNKGRWDKTIILNDTTYFKNMITPSQNINPSYGYLWWLNGQSKYMRPQSQTVFNSMLCPNAPTDMYAAMGAKGQIINIVPSMNLVVVRMGETPDSDAVPINFQNEMWAELRQIFVATTSINETPDFSSDITVTPNPFTNSITIYSAYPVQRYWLMDVTGKVVQTGTTSQIDAISLTQGVYFLKVRNTKGITETKKLVKAN